MILTAAWVAPISRPPLADAYVRLERDARGVARVAEVGRVADLPKNCAAPRCDLGRVLLAPGFINPHTHLELTCYRGQIAPGPFWPWVGALVALRRAPGQVQREQAAVLEGARLSLAAGVTCVGDISRRGLHWPVLKPLPLRKVCFVELLGFADYPARTVAELRAAVRSVVEDERLCVGLSAHAPYSVAPADVAAVAALAAELGRPWCMHWAETVEEAAFLRHGAALPHPLGALAARAGIAPPGRDALAALPPGAPAGALVHANYLSDDEISGLARLPHTVVICPRAHRFFGHAPHPLPRLRAAGVRVAVGTDSLASNDSLAPLEELRELRRVLPEIPADELWQMVTRSAAAALSIPDAPCAPGPGTSAAGLGTLTPGATADLIALPLPAATDAPLDACIAAAPLPTTVWIDGDRVL